MSMKEKLKQLLDLFRLHPLIKPLLEPMSGTSGKGYLIDGIKGGGYDNKRSWNFQKKLGKLRKENWNTRRCGVSYFEKYLCNTNGEPRNT